MNETRVSILLSMPYLENLHALAEVEHEQVEDVIRIAIWEYLTKNESKIKGEGNRTKIDFYPTPRDGGLYTGYIVTWDDKNVGFIDACGIFRRKNETSFSDDEKTVIRV